MIWVVIGLLLAVGYTYRHDLREVGDRVLAEMMPGRACRAVRPWKSRAANAANSRSRRDQRRADRDGLDTGASAVVLTQEAAKAAGLPLEVLNYAVRSRPRTAAPAPHR